MIYPDHFQSPLGVATCDTCHRTWPCHLSAWGSPAATSRCNACGTGTVRFKLELPFPCDA